MTNLPPRSRLIGLICLIILALLYFIFCVCLGWCNSGPGNGPSKKEKIVPMSFELINGETLQTADTTINIIIVDTEQKVLLSDRSRDTALTIQNGILPLFFIPDGREVSAEKPYRFKIEVQAEGYFGTFQSVLIKRTDVPVMKIIKLIPKTPSTQSNYGFVAKTSTFVGNDLSQKLELTADFIHSQDSNRIGVTILEKTKFLDAEGVPIENQNDSVKLQSRLAFFSLSRYESVRLFPGGCLVTDLVDVNGLPLATPDSVMFIRPVTWFSLDMKIGDKQVKKFKPVAPDSQVAMAVIKLDDDVIDPRTREPIQEGAKLRLWKLIRTSNPGPKFEEAPEEVIVGTDERGNAQVEVDIDEATTWTLGVAEENACSASITLDVVSPFEASRPFICELVNPIHTTPICEQVPGDLPCPGYPYFSDVVNFPGGETTTLTFEDVPQATPMAVAIFKEVDGGKHQIAAIPSNVFTTCEESPENQELIDDNDFTCLKIRVQFIFEVDGESVPKQVCNHGLWHRVAGFISPGEERDWLFAGFFEDEQMVTQEIIPQVPDNTVNREISIWYHPERDPIIIILPTDLVLHNGSDDPIEDGNVTYEIPPTVGADTTCIELNIRYDVDTSSGFLPEHVMACPDLEM